ncbi:MAG: DUF2189 domain-containing protein [Allosphingosinicella sp.]
MATIPPIVPPLPVDKPYRRELPRGSAFAWLRAGWNDLMVDPGFSLLRGVIVFLLSVAIVGGLIWFELDYLLLPTLAGFLIFGPAMAIGLYDKSRAIEQGEPDIRVARLEGKSGIQIMFIGAMLCGLVLLWVRAAILIYALFFGMRPFPGSDQILPMLFTTPTGWAMLAVGTLVGALFAAFAFAISAFSIPMLLDRKVDALTAMGTSWALVWNNLGAMLVWGAVVLALFLASLATGMLGLILVFPWLGHATWHAYRAVR